MPLTVLNEPPVVQYEANVLNNWKDCKLFLPGAKGNVTGKENCYLVFKVVN